jgi:RNA polymerase sigma-70 factor (ECF subfamily)
MAPSQADQLSRLALTDTSTRAGFNPGDAGQVLFGNGAGQVDASNLSQSRMTTMTNPTDPSTSVTPTTGLRPCTREEQIAVWERLEPHMGLIWKICRDQHPNEADAHDCVQEVALRFTRSRDKHSAVERMKDWVSEITRNVCWDLIRTKCRTRMVFQPLAGGDGSPDKRAGGEKPKDEDDFTDKRARRATLERDDRIDLAEAIRQLPPKERSVAEMWLGGKNVREMAKELGLTEKQVKSRRAKVRRRLRERLSYREEEGGVS